MIKCKQLISLVFTFPYFPRIETKSGMMIAIRPTPSLIDRGLHIFFGAYPNMQLVMVKMSVAFDKLRLAMQGCLRC